MTTLTVKKETSYEFGAVTWTLVPKPHETPYGTCENSYPQILQRGYRNAASTRLSICRTCGVEDKDLKVWLQEVIDRRAEAKVRYDARQVRIAHDDKAVADYDILLARYDALREAANVYRTHIGSHGVRGCGICDMYEDALAGKALDMRPGGEK